MEQSFWKKCWENPRLRALIKFLIWVIILAILIGVLWINNKINEKTVKEEPNKIKDTVNQPVEVEEEKIEYQDKLQQLVASDYEFIYMITKKDEKTRYEGKKINNIIYGYKQNTEGIIKYRIDGKKIYQILIDNEISISTLYDDIDSSLLDLNYILGLINQVAPDDCIVTEEEAITTYDYNLKGEEELEILVTENKSAIEQIMIKRNDEVYTLNYTLLKNI